MTILQEADALIHGDRHETYGHCLDEYERLAKMFNTAFAKKLREPFCAEEMLVVMILMKLNRHLTNPDHRDSLVDMAGYTGLIQEARDERKRRG